MAWFAWTCQRLRCTVRSNVSISSGIFRRSMCWTSAAVVGCCPGQATGVVPAQQATVQLDSAPCPAIVKRTWKKSRLFQRSTCILAQRTRLVAWCMPAHEAPTKQLHQVWKSQVRLMQTVDSAKQQTWQAVLAKHGCTADGLLRFQRIYPRVRVLSVENQIQPVIEYLFSLGIQSERLISILLKLPKLLACSPEGQLQARVEWLLQHHVEKEKLGDMLSKHPSILTRSIENGLQPVASWLVNVGVRHDEVGKVLAKNPIILTKSVEKLIQPVVDWLVKQGVPKDKVSSIVTINPKILSTDVESTLQLKADWLMQEGMSKGELVTFLVKHPQLFTSAFDDKFQLKIQYLRKVGLRPVNTGNTLMRLLSLTPETLQTRVEVLQDNFDLPHEFISFLVNKSPQLLTVDAAANFQSMRSYGFSLAQFREMVQRCSDALTLNFARVEQAERLKFYLDDVGYAPADIAEQPWLMMYPMWVIHQRMQAVRQVMGQKPSPWRFARMLQMTEGEFQECLHHSCSGVQTSATGIGRLGDWEAGKD